MKRPAFDGSGLVRSVAAGAPAIVLVAVLSIMLSLSYTALLFGLAPPAVQGQGLVMILISTVVLSVVGAARATLPVTLIAQDGAVVAGLATATAGLAAVAAGTGPGAAATFMMGLTLNTVLCAAALLAIGTLRAGAVVRFVPLQVMAGLLAAVGWSLLVGGVRVAVGSSPGHLIEELWSGQGGWKMAAALAGAVLLVTMARRLRSPWLLPGLVATGTALHHTVFHLAGWSLSQQRAEGWLLAPSTMVQPFVPWSPSQLALVDWGALLTLLPGSAALAAIVVVTVMLNASGLELALGKDVEVDRDLRAHGWANMAAAAAGGVLGCASITRSALLARAGTGQRWVTAAAGIGAGITPLLYPGMLGLLPRPVMGAVLLQVGWGILKVWLIDSRRRLSLLEWLTVPTVLAVMVQFGLGPAVLAGMTLGCMTFAVLYSRGSPIRARYRGDVARSHVDRPAAERQALAEQSDATLVLYLQGFLFFGTANRLLAEVRAEVAASAGRLRAVVLDLSNIDGLDGSARNVLARLQQVAAANGFTLHGAGAPAEARSQLASLPSSPAPVMLWDTLDQALEWCEGAVLAAHESLATATATFSDEIGEAAGSALERAMEVVQVPAGYALMRQGELSEDLFFVAEGRASVTFDAPGGVPVRVRSFGPGTMVGEIGFLLGAPRTATVTTDTPCRLLRLTRQAYAGLAAQEPAAVLDLQRLVMLRLSNRLLDKDHLIAALMRGAR